MFIFFVLRFNNFPCCFYPVVKATIFQWTLEHDVAMRSPERGQVCENIVAALNSLQQPKFGVTASQELFEIGIQV